MGIFLLPGPDSVNKRIFAAGLGTTNFFDKKYEDKIFAVVLRDTPLKVYPSYSMRPSPEGFDLNCETLCRCCDIVILLSHVPVHGFFRVHTKNSTGFIDEEQIAIIPRETALKLLSGRNILCVTDKFVFTNPSPVASVSKILLSFGTIVPLAPSSHEKGSLGNLNHTILLPSKGTDGSAVWERAYIPKSVAVHEGYLRFTRKNLLKLSLHMRGMPYDWGESFGGCDCSSLICAAFSLCGITLPRNSDKIAQISSKAVIITSPVKQLGRANPGDIIAGDGHVMLYYGKHRGDHYVFHSFYGTHGVTDITTISEPTSDGTPLVENFRKIIPLNFI
ncbi:MAG: NlpC/P60 family protein [Bacillota bacterium]|nr:NlpC/P60 family protein [Bacillota bacterium]